MDDLDRAVQQLAAQQGGVLTREQAVALGMSAAQVATALRSGRWLPARYGAHAPVSELPPAGSAESVALQVAAVQLRATGRPVAAGPTAALLHGLPYIGRRLQEPLLVWPRAVGGRPRRDVPTWWLPEEQVVRVHGVLATSSARTAFDIARTSSLLSGVAVADGFLAAGGAREGLSEVVEACGATHGKGRAEEAFSWARVGAESVLESLGRVRAVQQGLPEPELQVEIYDEDGFVGRVDQLWRRQRVIGEADGLGKYDTPHVLRAEKLREDRLRDTGFEVIRYTWDEALRRPERLAARVRAAFARAARRAA